MCSASMMVGRFVVAGARVRLFLYCLAVPRTSIL